MVPEVSDSKTDWKLALALFVAAGLGYAALGLALPVTTYDGLMYLELAKNIPREGYVFLGAPHEKFLPLYPALMALLDVLTRYSLGPKIFGYLIGILSGASLPPLIFLMARRLQAPRNLALFAGFLQMALAVGLDQYRDIAVMPLFTALFTLMLLLILSENFFLAGLVAGLAVTTRYELYLFLPLFFFGQLRVPRTLARAGAGFLITALPWWVRNWTLYGHFNHTQYFKEVIYTQFHLPEIGLGLVREFGPVVLLAAGVGFMRLPRKWKLFLGGFTLLYLAIHTVWWWYRDRFLLLLAPPLLVAAALGLEPMLSFTARRLKIKGRAASALVLSALVLPVLVRAGFFFAADLTRPADPFEQAAVSLSNEPAADALLGANLFLLYAYSGHPAYSWEKVPEKMETQRFVLELYQKFGVRFIVWANYNPTDLAKFGFLKNGQPFTAEVSSPEGQFRISYLFLREYRAGPDKQVIVYSIRADKIVARSP